MVQQLAESPVQYETQVFDDAEYVPKDVPPEQVLLEYEVVFVCELAVTVTVVELDTLLLPVHETE